MVYRDGIATLSGTYNMRIDVSYASEVLTHGPRPALFFNRYNIVE